MPTQLRDNTQTMSAVTKCDILRHLMHVLEMLVHAGVRRLLCGAY